MDGKKISGFVPPARVQRVWYLFKRSHRLRTKHGRNTPDLHCKSFLGKAEAIERRRSKLARSIKEESFKHRDWIEMKIEQAFLEPGRVIGV